MVEIILATATSRPTQEVSTDSVKSTASAKEICEKISCLTAEQIELLGMKIAQEIISYLGPIGNAIAAAKILKKQNSEGKLGNEESNPLTNVRKRIIMRANELIKKSNNEAFFNDEKRARLILSLLRQIKRELETAVSLPENFMEKGLFISLSDYDPREVISNISKKTDIKISKFDIPLKYSIKFGSYFDYKKSELVFYITHKSYNCEFSQVLFTLKELEDKHLGNFPTPKSKL